MKEYEIIVDKRFKSYRTVKLDLKPFRYTKLRTFEKDIDYIKYIKGLERKIRSALEYRDYIQYLKETQDLTNCSFYHNLDKEVVPHFPIEQHHSPLTLFDITCIITNQYFATHGYYNSLAICNAVLKQHYAGNVGLIPLSITIHKLAHTGDIFIPVNTVFGDWYDFVEEYKEWFTDDQLKSLEFKKTLTSDIMNGKIPFSFPVLSEEVVKLDMNGVSLDLPLMDPEIKEVIRTDKQSKVAA